MGSQTHYLSEVSSSRSSEAAFILIMVGMIMQGISKSPRFAYVTYFIDNNVDKNKTGFYTGVLIAVSIFGPILSFVLGGLFSKIYVTLQHTVLTPRHPQWIGAWWLGYMAFGIVSIFISIPFFFFPREFKADPPLQRKMDSPKTELSTLVKLKTEIKGFLAALFRLVSNPIYTCYIVAGCFAVFKSAGLHSFSAKYFETQFSLPTWEAVIWIASSSMVSASAGTLFGGVLTRKLRMTTLGCIKMMAGIEIAMVVMFGIQMTIKCEQPAIYNMPDGYQQSENGSCFASCECVNDKFRPVCGSDGRTYFSPCRAGCIMAVDQRTYTNCTCVPDGIATAGTCDYRCNSFYFYLAATIVGSFINTSLIAANTVGLIRCVSAADKALAIGVYTFASSAFGWMLGPVIFGRMVDGTCALWDVTCGVRGRCLLYHNDKFRTGYFSYSMVSGAIGVVFYVACFLFARFTKRLKNLAKEAADQAIQIEATKAENK